MPLPKTGLSWLALCTLVFLTGVGWGLWRGGMWLLVALAVCQVVFLLGWRRQLIPAVTRAAVVAAVLATGMQTWLVLAQRRESGLALTRASQVLLCAVAASVVLGFVVQFTRRPPRRAATVSLAAGVAAALVCLLGAGWLVSGRQVSDAQHLQIRLAALAGVVVGLGVEGGLWWLVEQRRLRRLAPWPQLALAWVMALMATGLGALVAGVGARSWLAAAVGAGSAAAGCASVRVSSMISFRNISAPRPALRPLQRLVNPLTRLAVGSSMGVLLAGVVVLSATTWTSR